MRKKTMTEVMIERRNNIEVLKAKFLYELFGSCVVETAEGFTIKPKLLLAKIAEIIY